MKIWRLLPLLFLVCLWDGAPVMAQTPVLISENVGDINPFDLSAYVDGIMSEQMKRDNIAGATVAVVDHNTVFLRGYGEADVANEVDVTADTMFRIGSITKLFTWVSVMQLVEQGVLDLDTDINQYLDFDIPNTYDKPITLRHLMSHTPGFEDSTYGLTAPDIDSLQTNGDWLKANIPRRIYPSGEVLAYSNYGAALGGYIVALASGQSFADYVAKNITQPLGMTHTTMRQPVPPQLESFMSKSYSVGNASFDEGIFELFHPDPAGSASASAHDMALFMLAMMNEGGGILRPETVAQMHETTFRMDESVNGYTLGWMELDQGNTRIVGHGGDTAFFHSMLVIVPEREFGLFISYNTDAAMLQPYLFSFSLFERYIGLDSTYTADTTIDLAPYAGAYRMARRNISSAEKLIQLATPFTMSVDGNELVVNGFTGSGRYQAVTPTLFHAVDTPELIAFKLDADGRPISFALGNIPVTEFERLGWYETPTFTLGLLGIILSFYGLTLVAAGVDWVQRISTDKHLPKTTLWIRRRALLLITLTFALLLGFTLPLNGMLDVMQGNVPIYRYVMVLPWLIAAVTTWTMIGAWKVWQDKAVGWFGRIHYSLLVVASWLFMAWMSFWQFFAGMP